MSARVHECPRCHTRSEGAGWCYCLRGGVTMIPVPAREMPGPITGCPACDALALPEHLRRKAHVFCHPGGSR